MNYEKIYEQLISRAQSRVYVRGQHEKHHICPRSLGGSNERSNIAILTYREHFLAHWLLSKFKKGQERLKMLHALDRISQNSEEATNRLICSWQYEIARRAKIEALLGNSHAKGYKHNEEFIEKMRGNDYGKANKGRKHTSETKTKLSLKRMGNQNSKGYKHPPEFGEKIRQARTGTVTPEETIQKIRDNRPNARKVKCITTGKIFEKVSEAEKFYGVYHVNDVCSGKRQHTKRLLFEYI